MKKILLFILLLTPFMLCALDYDLIPFQGKSKRITTENFVIIYPEVYEEEGQKTALYAEEIFTYLSPFFDWDPWLKITVILTDHTDIPNGMAYPIPRSTIQLRLTPSDSALSLRDYDDPLYSLLLHEMAHALQLDQIRGGAWLWRVLYGRLYFPNVNAFRWYHEGTAVLAETIFAGGGRLDSHYNHAIIRNMAIEKTIPSFDKLVLPVVDFPHGQATYHLGARFLEYMVNTYGEEKFRTFFIDQSNDFWPFICEFVLKFRKVYGKSLRNLWDEWKAYEESNVTYVPYKREKEKNRLTELKGRLYSLSIKENPMTHRDGSPDNEPGILFASSSHTNEAHTYTLPEGRDPLSREIIKIRTGKVQSVSYTNNPDYLIMTKITGYPGGFEYYDIYSYKISTGIEKKLTRKGRIGYLDFSHTTERGVFVQNLYNKATLFTARFTGESLEDIQEIKLPADFSFIGSPSLDDDNSKVLFSARRGKDNFSIFVYDLENEILEEITSIKGRNPAWLDRNTFTFVGKDATTDCLFSFNRDSKKLHKLVETDGFIMEGRVAGDTVYYIDYTHKGEELFITAYLPEEYSYDFSAKSGIERPAHFDSTDDSMIPDFTSKAYNPLAYLYPTTWAFLPVQLNSRFLLNGINIPVVGPQYMIHNRLPLGRFAYSIWVTMDYMKMYPENGLNLLWKLPFLNISYSWHNWASGFRAFVVRGMEGATFINSLGSRYPIGFSNSLSISTNLEFNTINFGAFASATHGFDEYNFYKGRTTNTITFSEGFSLSMTEKRSRSSRWDRGIYGEITGHQSPPLLDNNWYYMIKAKIEGRVPIGPTFFFIDCQGGVELLLQDIFAVGTDSLRLNSTILANGSSSANRIDTKAFGTLFSSLSIASPTGTAYFAADMGFDISVYRRTHYAHFLTLGFKEFYIRPYNESIYLFSKEFGHQFISDIALELCLDLFMFYGNISIQIVQGAAFGIHLKQYSGNSGNFIVLSPNVYTYLSIGL